MANARAGRLRVLTAAAAALCTAAGLGGAVAGSAAAAPGARETGEVHGADSPDAIPGSYLVLLEDEQMSAREARTNADDLAESYDAEVERTYNTAIQGFAARMSEQDASEMAADPSVRYVEANQEVRLSATQTNPPWGLDRIDQVNLPLDGDYRYFTTASNVNAYVIDTGIDVTHQEFDGRAQVGTDTVGDGRNGRDCHGHGTHVAGTIGSETYGIAKDVNLHGVRVLDCDGSGTTLSVVQGIEWVTENAVRPAVANMSLGGRVDTILDEAITNSIASSVTYAVAAGNEGRNACTSSPARVPGALTAGATDNSDTRAGFSNFGRCVDMFAPGVGIRSTVPGGTRMYSGTSMSSPHVAGAAAMILAWHPRWSPAQVAERMISNATVGVVRALGRGSPNLLLHKAPQP
ncbi:MAG: S8 family serine peptidase [Propionibacteriales bacterium]|nr:S8 family serine peptidase [Propionibacteriales bacterium]